MQERRKTTWERIEAYLYRVKRPVRQGEWSTTFYVKLQGLPATEPVSS